MGGVVAPASLPAWVALSLAKAHWFNRIEYETGVQPEMEAL